MRTIELRKSPKRIKLVSPRGLDSVFGTTIAHNTQFNLSEIVPIKRNMSLRTENPEDSSRVKEHHRQSFITWDARDRAYNCLEHSLFTVKAAPIKHSVFCVGYVLQEKDIRGKILVEKLRKDHGLEPGPLFKEFALKPEVKLPSGITVRSYL